MIRIMFYLWKEGDKMIKLYDEKGDRVRIDKGNLIASGYNIPISMDI